MKTQKINMRKKALLSSVAMLLIALFALGTATYAWFSAKSTADVNGISMTSASAAGLLISKDNATWGDLVEFDNTADAGLSDVLNPASSAFASAQAPVFFSATADTPTSYVASSYAQLTSGLTGYVNKYTFYAKNADPDGSNALTISSTDLIDAGGYGRIAIVVDNTLMAYYKADGDAGIFPVTGVDSLATDYPMTPINSIASVELGTLTAAAKTIDIYVWNEGQDLQCNSNNANQALTCTFDLALATE